MAGPSVIQVAVSPPGATAALISSGLQLVNGPDGTTPIDWMADKLYVITATAQVPYNASPTLTGLTSPDYAVIPVGHSAFSTLNAYMWLLVPSADETATVTLDYGTASTGQGGYAVQQIVGAAVGLGAAGLVVQSDTDEVASGSSLISLPLATFADRGNLAFSLAAMQAQVMPLHAAGWVQASVVPNWTSRQQMAQWLLRDPSDPLLRPVDPPGATWTNGTSESVIVAAEISMQTSGA